MTESVWVLLCKREDNSLFSVFDTIAVVEVFADYMDMMQYVVDECAKSKNPAHVYGNYRWREYKVRYSDNIGEK